MSSSELSLSTQNGERRETSIRRPSSSGWQRLVRRAGKQAEQGQYPQAIASLEQAIHAGADKVACYLHLADLHRSLRQWKAAEEAAARAIALAPEETPGYEIMMTLALEAGDCERALAYSAALLKLSPRHVPAYDVMGAAYIQMGDVDAAMRVTNTLIRLDPETAAHHFKKALLCQHKGEIALAVQEFTEAITLDPDGAHAEAAREALETLDAFQLNQIVTLAIEDMVFRLKLERDAVEAVSERGFYLSEMGNQMLIELSRHTLAEFPEPGRTCLYN